MASIKHEFRFDAPPEAVFEALTDQEALRRWWTVEAETNGQVGSTARFGFSGDDGAYANVTLWDADPPKHLQWRCTESKMLGTREWEETIIDWRLTPDGEGTVLRLLHHGFDHESDCVRACDDGWRFYIGESLARYLESGQGTPYTP